MILIAGGLGSGKTTLLKRLLTGEYGRLAVLVNEFGEIGIDGDTIGGTSIHMTELTGGCVCCSLAGEFEAAVEEILDTVAPDAVVVETTGVAEADALVMDIEESLPRVRIETVAVLVDADVWARFPELGYTEKAQLETADLILLNKTDLVEPGMLKNLHERLHSVNPDAPLIETTYADIDLRLLVPDSHESGRHAGQPSRAGGNERHRHGDEFASFYWRVGTGNLRRGCFETAVQAWPREIYRAKGRVVVDGRLYLFNYVAGRWSLDPVDAKPDGNEALVWIGPGIERHREAMVSTLEACLA